MGAGANYTSRVSYAKQLMDDEAIYYMNISYIDGNDWLVNYSLKSKLFYLSIHI